MIDISEARSRIKESLQSITDEILISIEDSLGYVLSKDIYSPLDLPAFNQSAMDGYAFRFDDASSAKSLKIIGEVPAGSTFEGTITSGTTVRIFTGAKVPEQLDTVVMQEKTKTESDQLLIEDTHLKLGANIRTTGAQLKKDELALPKGQKMNAAGIAFLASMGISEINCFRKPAISILATGSELKKSNQKLKAGEIYESNTMALKAVLASLFIEPTYLNTVADDEKLIADAISEALKKSDMLIITGGISVGKYDHVKSALLHVGVTEIFHKINQKPGKPIFYGSLDEKVVFALPGNPAAVLSCFYEYVYPAMDLLQNCHQNYFHKIQLPLTQSFTKKKGRGVFLKAAIDQQGSIEILDGQLSYILHTYTTANAHVFLEGDVTEVKKGQMVEVHLLPGIL